MLDQVPGERCLAGRPGVLQRYPLIFKKTEKIIYKSWGYIMEIDEL